MDYKPNTTIASWAEEDKPREKLILKGKNALSDSELLAILLGSGTHGQSAVGLSRSILRACDGDLMQLGKRTLEELVQFRGIGTAKAIKIIAALELGRRRHATNVKTRPQIRSSHDAYKCLVGKLEDLSHEEFHVIFLNRNNRVTRIETISVGGVAGTVVDPKIIFKKALLLQASSIILSHNHPSGNLAPSQADIDMTKKIKSSGLSLEIQVLDHLIISENGYFSFADEGMM